MLLQHFAIETEKWNVKTTIDSVLFFFTHKHVLYAYVRTPAPKLDRQLFLFHSAHASLSAKDEIWD